MTEVPFAKMAGAGNDFVIIDNRGNVLSRDLPGAARRLTDRKRGIGADGLILLDASKKADVRMRIFNPDGSEAEMCGNGVRCLAKFAVVRGIAAKRHTVETLAGTIQAEVNGDVIRARLSDPGSLALNQTLDVDGRKETVHTINTGVPHAVFVVSSLKKCDVAGTGRKIRYHRHFAPKGTNVDFVYFKSHRMIHIRTYERGVEDETLACGTGSVAAALVAAALKKMVSPVLVHTGGGEILKVHFSKKDNAFSNVVLEGKVETCFEGRISL